MLARIFPDRFVPILLATILLAFGPAHGDPLLFAGLLGCVALVLMLTQAYRAQLGGSLRRLRHPRLRQ